MCGKIVGSAACGRGHQHAIADQFIDARLAVEINAEMLSLIHIQMCIRDRREGMKEAEAFARIAEEMSRPETCTLGWNSLRFDDEFVRHGLFRNFHDPYEREWRGGNSRWDLLDVMRLAHALRPEGIIWPRREDGATSFKLEHLALANDVREGDAHEALSDVYATLGMARRLSLIHI